MRVGLYQCASPSGDIEAGLTQVRHALSGAAEQQVDMLVLPELFLPGYNATSAKPPEGWGEVLPTLRDLCTNHQVALTIGLPHYHGARVYNSAHVLDARGNNLAHYSKIQLFGQSEQEIFAPGDQLVTFDYLGMRFGVLICYDVEFPEHTRALARAGASVILCPTANMAPFINVNDITVPGRAVESGISIVYANYCGSEGDLDYVGNSLICGPDGYPLAKLDTEPGLIWADLPNNGTSCIPLSTQLTDYRPAKEPL